MKKKADLKTQATKINPFAVGQKILIRTVTMIQLGRIIDVGPDYILLEDGGWVADTARFGLETLTNGKLNEFERSPGKWFGVGRGAIVDFWPWDHELPQSTI
jgi:hypothetical protein